MKKQTEVTGIAGIIIALIVLLFGDNIYEQINGRSFFEKEPSNISQPSETPFVFSQPTVQPTNTFIPTQFIPPTITPTIQLPPMPMGHRQVADLGSSDLILTSNQVAIGTADRFKDVLDMYNPQFTIFVIYGQINIQLQMFWGGWDLWENASENFIDSQIALKIDEVKSSHAGDYMTRGYRVIKCYGQVENCETILTFP